MIAIKIYIKLYALLHLLAACLNMLNSFGILLSISVTDQIHCYSVHKIIDNTSIVTIQDERAIYTHNLGCVSFIYIHSRLKIIKIKLDFLKTLILIHE